VKTPTLAIVCKRELENRLSGLPAGRFGQSDMTSRRDGDWLTGSAIAGARADRRRADIAALACTFHISVEGFADAGLAGDLVGEETVLFGAGRVGAIVFF
jgi:hypothetical protein